MSYGPAPKPSVVSTGWERPELGAFPSASEWLRSRLKRSLLRLKPGAPAFKSEESRLKRGLKSLQPKLPALQPKLR